VVEFYTFCIIEHKNEYSTMTHNLLISRLDDITAVIHRTYRPKFEDNFTARSSYASAVLGIVTLSVRPSVRTSVCHMRKFTSRAYVKNETYWPKFKDIILFWNLWECKRFSIRRLLDKCSNKSKKTGKNKSWITFAKLMKNEIDKTNCRKLSPVFVFSF